MFAVLLLATHLQWPPPYVHPATYTSEDGQFVYHVDPSDRHGRSEARYSLHSPSGESWSTTLGFTLHDARVTQNGLLVGHGLSPSDGPLGLDAVLVGIAPDGTLRWMERTHRRFSRTIHGPTEPWLRGLFIDEDAGQAVFRLRQWEPDTRGQIWLRIGLESGDRAPDLSIDRAFAQAGLGQVIVHDARAVHGTGLSLVALYDGLWDSDHDAAYALIDPNGKVIWRCSSPLGDDAAALRAQNLPRHERRHRRVILDVGRRSFEVWFPRSGERVSFEVREGPAVGGSWSVIETESAKRSDLLAVRTLPIPIQLEPIERVELAAPPRSQGDREVAPLGYAAARAVLTDGRLAIEDGPTGRLFVWNEDGSFGFIGPRDGGDTASVSRRPGSIEIDDDGTIWIEAGGKRPHVGWGTSGERAPWNRDAGYLCSTTDSGEWRADSAWQSVTLFRPDGASERTLERTPDGRWITHVIDAEVLDDGPLLLLAAGLSPAAPGPQLHLWPTNGGIPRQIELPFVPHFRPQIRTVGRNAVIGGTSSVLLLVDLQQESVVALSVADLGPPESHSSGWGHGLSPDGSALLSLRVTEGAPSLYRFALTELRTSSEGSR